MAIYNALFSGGPMGGLCISANSWANTETFILQRVTGAQTVKTVTYKRCLVAAPPAETSDTGPHMYDYYPGLDA